MELYFTDHMHTSAKNRINKATKQDEKATVSTPAVKLEIAHSWDKLDKMLLFSIIVDSGAPQSCHRVLLNKFIILCVELTWCFSYFFLSMHHQATIETAESNECDTILSWRRQMPGWVKSEASRMHTIEEVIACVHWRKFITKSVAFESMPMNIEYTV